MTIKTYTAKTPIKHNGEDIAVGDTVDLDDKTEAPQLIAVDAIDETPVKKATAK
jgi:hypothetical protein